MKIYAINPFTPHFAGKREDRKSVAQLKTDNVYDLNIINQRRISNAIENLSNVPGEDNVNFLIDVSENLKYGTNIDLGKQSYNDWQVKLNNAAKKSLALSDEETQKRLTPRLKALLSSKKELNDDEIEILNLRKSILSKVDKKQLEAMKYKNIQNISSNLDYFIISSEVPLSQKLYIMKRLDYFMSPEYEINPQLKNRKTQALAEIVNDIVVKTPESKIPNIKAVNQKDHSMCAAISKCRKALAYEDKANYVDMILSELDSSEYMQVYDITKLGSHTKIPVAKAEIDYDYALSLGYRIIDTSVLNWMNIANTAGAANEFVGVYKAFDKNNFDVFQDSHLTMDLDDKSLADSQDWYRTLAKAESVIKEYKRNTIKQNYKKAEKYNKKEQNFKLGKKLNTLLKNKINNLAPEMSPEKAQKISYDLLRLKVSNSDNAKKVNDYKKDFVYLPNEPEQIKNEKIKAFLAIALADEKDVKLDDDSIKNINALVDEIHILTKNRAHASSYFVRQIAKAEDLYKAAAAYRVQHIYQTFIPEQLNDMRNDLNIPDDETLIDKNMDYLISKLENNTINPKLKEILAKNFDSDNDNEALIESLKGNKETLDYMMTSLMDDLYACCLSVDQKTALVNELTAIKNAIVEDNDKLTLLKISDTLHIKDNKKAVLDTLDKYISTLKSDNCTHQQYIEIFNKTGHKSNMLMFKETFERLGRILFDSENPNLAIIQGFNLKNGLPKDAPKEQTVEVYNKIWQTFSQISGLVVGYQYALEIPAGDGDKMLNTVNPKRLVIKKLENIGDIIPEKDLALLQNRFTRIEDALITPEGESVRYRNLPKELLMLTPRENEILEHIESKINGWYAFVSRALKYQYAELKEPLSELNRQKGLKTGEFWVNPEGHGGLYNAQEVRIIEYMTDRPYYIENNGKYAVKKIKRSPYSGTSSTSVDSLSQAWHAQYIADIKPIEVTENGKKVQKDVIFHDNTWGPQEHRNTWVDDNNLLRTDYSSRYGGELGYITDDNYLAGKFVDNMIGAVGHVQPEVINNKNYKKLHGASGEYMFPMFSDIITPGKYPNAGKYVRMIRDNTLISPYAHIDQLEKYAKNMTQSEIKSVIGKAETISDNLSIEYNNIEKRVFGRKPFTKGIETRADYDKLPDNDKLKLLFEKMALIRSYKGIPNQRIFYTQTSMEDLDKIRKQIKTEARKNFDYVFAKNPDIAKYGAESVRTELNALLDALAKVNNIKINNNQKNAIVNSLKNINKNEFNGSLEKTIDLMADSFEKTLAKNTPQFSYKDRKIKEMANNVRNLLRTNMGFTLADLSSSSFDDDNMKNIVTWIDETFDPSTNEELVQIFNNLRNMTTKEFNSKYNSKITNEAIGIKPVTGYDVLLQFKGMDRRTHNMLYNIMFNEKLGLKLNMSKIIPVYEYNKVSRKLRSARYANNKRTFDDIYFDYYYTLRTITIGKQYDAIKQNVFEKTRMFPAYPKYDPEVKENTSEVLQKFYKDIDEQVEAIISYKIQDKTIKIIKNLKKYTDNLPSDSLSDKQYNKLQKDFSALLEMIDEDESIPKTVEAAHKALELDRNTPLDEYKALIAQIYDEMDMFLTTIDKKTVKQSVKESIQTIETSKKDILSYVDSKYQSKAAALLNKWISAKAKENPDCDKYYDEFCEMYKKHTLPRTPEKLLNKYLLLLAKPDNGEQNLNQSKDEVTENLKASLATDVRGLLYQASLLEMQYILMDCASESNLNIVRDEFKKSKLQLRNGSVVTLDSDIAINLMLAPLLADDDMESAVMFLEQLGLAEQVVEMATKNNSFDKAKGYIKRINSIFSSVSKQTNIVKDEIDKIGNIDNDLDYQAKLDIMHDNIVRKFKNTNYRVTIKIMDQAFKDLNQDIKEHPKSSKTGLLILHMDEAKTASIAAATYQVQTINEKLKRIQKVRDLIVKLTLPENSPANKAREEYLKGFHEVEETISRQRYDNLNLTTLAV